MLTSGCRSRHRACHLSLPPTALPLINDTSSIIHRLCRSTSCASVFTSINYIVQSSTSQVGRHSASLLDSLQSLLALRYERKKMQQMHTSCMTLNSVCTSRVHGISISCPPVTTASEAAAPTFDPAPQVSSNHPCRTLMTDCPTVCVRPSGVFTAILIPGSWVLLWFMLRVRNFIQYCEHKATLALGATTLSQFY